MYEEAEKAERWMFEKAEKTISQLDFLHFFVYIVNVM